MFGAPPRRLKCRCASMSRVGGGVRDERQLWPFSGFGSGSRSRCIAQEFRGHSVQGIARSTETLRDVKESLGSKNKKLM